MNEAPGRRSLGSIWSSLPDFSTHGTKLRMAGQPIQIKGASWFGAEGPSKVPDGLWVNDVPFYLKFLASHGFNAVRLPFALDNVLSNAVPSGDLVKAAPSLRNLHMLDVLEHVVDVAAEHNLLVLLDLHRVQSTRWPDDGMWYGPSVNMNQIKEGWDRVQGRLCNRWNVFGADIFNEPHGASWDAWTAAAADLGDFVLSKCQRWLIFVEGVAHVGSDTSSQGARA